MTVAVEKGLENVKNALKNKGYTVIDADKNPVADAYVFSGRQTGALSANSCFKTARNGVLMINAQNKSPDEIDRILKSRLYDPLFIF